jgi:hypothetical protein
MPVVTVWLLLTTTPYGEGFPGVYVDQKTCNADLVWTKLQAKKSHDPLLVSARWRCVQVKVRTKTTEVALQEKGVVP